MSRKLLSIRIRNIVFNSVSVTSFFVLLPVVFRFINWWMHNCLFSWSLNEIKVIKPSWMNFRNDSKVFELFFLRDKMFGTKKLPLGPKIGCRGQKKWLCKKKKTFRFETKNESNERNGFKLQSALIIYIYKTQLSLF